MRRKLDLFFALVRKVLFLLPLFAFCFFGEMPSVFASDRRLMTLEDVIDLARAQSPDALAARHRYRGSYWRFRSFRAGYLPNLSLEATVPNLNRTISPVTLPDGTDVFV